MCCLCLATLGLATWLGHRVGCAAYEAQLYTQMQSGGMSYGEYRRRLNAWFWPWTLLCLSFFGGAASWLLYATYTIGSP